MNGARFFHGAETSPDSAVITLRSKSSLNRSKNHNILVFVCSNLNLISCEKIYDLVCHVVMFLKSSLLRIIRGLGTEIVVQIASGDHHSLALTKGGQVFAWGDYTFGQLGFGKLPVDKVNTPQVLCLNV